MTGSEGVRQPEELERKLTLDQVRRLSARFKLSADVFIAKG